MTEPKTPQDHKKKAPKFDLDQPFSFTYEDEKYEFKSFEGVVTPGFIRKNRKNEDADVTYTLIELLTDEDTLDVLDNMGLKEHSKVQESFGEYFQQYVKATLGESSAS